MSRTFMPRMGDGGESRSHKGIHRLLRHFIVYYLVYHTICCIQIKTGCRVSMTMANIRPFQRWRRFYSKESEISWTRSLSQPDCVQDHENKMIEPWRKRKERARILLWCCHFIYIKQRVKIQWGTKGFIFFFGNQSSLCILKKSRDSLCIESSCWIIITIQPLLSGIEKKKKKGIDLMEFWESAKLISMYSNRSDASISVWRISNEKRLTVINRKQQAHFSCHFCPFGEGTVSFLYIHPWLNEWVIVWFWMGWAWDRIKEEGLLSNLVLVHVFKVIGF